jgi:hypothetical protein
MSIPFLGAELRSEPPPLTRSKFGRSRSIDHLSPASSIVLGAWFMLLWLGGLTGVALLLVRGF